MKYLWVTTVLRRCETELFCKQRVNISVCFKGINLTCPVIFRKERAMEKYKINEINKEMLVSDENDISSAVKGLVICKIDNVKHPYIVSLDVDTAKFKYAWEIEEPKQKKYMIAKEMYQFCKKENPANKFRYINDIVFNWGFYSFDFASNTYGGQPISEFVYSLDLITWHEFLKED
jgi:hypothetical protein